MLRNCEGRILQTGNVNNYKKRQGGHNSEKQQANQVSEVSLNFKGKEAKERCAKFS